MMAARTFPFVSQVRLQAREEGRAEARAEALAAAIFTVLDSRGIAVDLDSRTRIESGRDAETLVIWLRRAAIVANISDLFA